MIGSIFVSWNWDLISHGVSTLGKVPSGLPNFRVPDVTWGDIPQYAGTIGALFLVILAQSAATSRAYAAKYQEPFDENVDLVGLGIANASAGLSGTFVVNGSPTKTQMVDGAGGKSHQGLSPPRRCACVLPPDRPANTSPAQLLVGGLPHRRSAR